MKVTKIGDIFDGFINSNLSAIMISGSWGIGKTYAVQEYLQKKKEDKDYMFVYCSVFGKTSIDDLNSEIYYKLHPTIAKLGIFASVASRFAKIAGIDAEIDFKELRKDVKNNSNKQVIIIIDDFERKDSNAIKTDVFTGYLNNLIDDGIKVVVFANLESIKELDKKEPDNNILAKAMGEYAEKIFDRIYLLEEADDEIIKSAILKEDILDISEHHIFDKNLRVAKKAKGLYDQVCKYLNKNFADWQKAISKKELLIISAQVIQEVLTGKYTKLVEEQRAKDKKDGWWLPQYDKKNKKSYNMSMSIQAITGNILKQNLFIDAVIDITLEEDYTLLNELLKNKLHEQKLKEENKQLFESSIYFESDEARVDLLRKQINYTLNSENNVLNKQLIKGFLADWGFCFDSERELINEKESEIFAKMNSLEFDSLDFYVANGEMQEFKNRYYNYRRELNVEKKTKVMQDLDRVKLSIELEKLSRANAWNPEEMDIVKQVIIKNNYYIENLHSKVSDLDWSIAISICRLCSYYSTDDNYQKGLLKVLKDYMNKYPNDNACNQRINSLIKQHQLET